MEILRWWQERRWRKLARHIEARIRVLARRCMLDVGTGVAAGAPPSRFMRHDIAWEYACLFHHLAKEVILDELNSERADDLLGRIRGVLVPAWIEFEFQMPGMWPALQHRRDVSELASLRRRSLDTSDELYEYVKFKAVSLGGPTPLSVVLDAVGDKAADLGVEFDVEENARRLEMCSLEFVDFVRRTLGRDLGEVRAASAKTCLVE